MRPAGPLARPTGFGIFPDAGYVRPFQRRARWLAAAKRPPVAAAESRGNGVGANEGCSRRAALVSFITCLGGSVPRRSFGKDVATRLFHVQVRPVNTARIAVLAAAMTAVASACMRRDPLLQPRAADVAAAAPDSFLVRFATTRGDFVVKARRHWSPAGVDRLHYLARHGFYDEARFHRVVPGFVVQFGIPAAPEAAAVWRDLRLPDDSVRTSNRRGTVSFARGGRESRTAQLFINLADNARLDTLGGFGFPPIGEVVQGMNVVDSLYGGYADRALHPGGAPSQDSIRLQGNAYLDRNFPRLDAIRSAVIVTEWKKTDR